MDGIPMKMRIHKYKEVPMKKILSLFLCLTALTVQATDLKPCEPYTKDSYGNLHIQYSKSKQENVKIQKCMAFLQAEAPQTAVYFEHPLRLANFYATRLKDQGFRIYDINEDTQTVTWLWRNGRNIPDRWTTETAVRVVVRNGEGKLLLVKSEGIPVLLVPGGGVPKGTLARDAAVDLLKNEIGITTRPKDLKLIGLLNRTNVYGFKGLNEVTYIFALDNGTEPHTSTAIEKLYWVTQDEIKKGTVEGIQVHPFAGPLANQAFAATTKKGHMRMSDPSEMTMPPMMDVEFIPA
jgi:ADP-ribose pyrophosphatase YjhB (NUDIX family)/mRNA-degrading endonuclease YafQ of YafQ-DinJ toxin-antitoxin module